MIEILLVDDESYVTESLAQTIPWRELQVEQVYQADSAAKALGLLEEQSVDIVVTDIRMPVTDGLRLIEEIAKRWPHIRCILLTGHSDFEYAKRAIQLQAFDYILKPVNDEEFIASLSNAIESLKDEWSETEKYHQLLHNRKADFTVLRSSLMHDLLLGRKLLNKTITEKMEQYEIRLKVDEPAVMILVQMGNHFRAMDHNSAALMEYAVGNIAEEVFGGEFDVWHGKAPHDCLAIIAQMKEAYHQSIRMRKDYEAARRALLEQHAHVLQKHVSNYLKGGISLAITGWFAFPEELPGAYRAGLGAMLLQSDDERSIAFLEDRASAPGSGEAHIKSLECLYKPPTLIHLLESKQWEAARAKIGDVFAQLEQARASREHLYELFLSVTNAFMYMAHKQGHFIAEIDQAGMDFLLDRSIVHSIDKLRTWSLGMLEKLEKELSANDKFTKSYIVKQVQEIVSSELGQDVSVKTIADRVYLHPVYLSKIYKAETGESLGDYIIRMRMERAHYLLKSTNKKIYEITLELGYQNPQYFSKMFKKFYGMTPNEFRD
ncbi:response regulator transcription factor [Paenibacillus sp.]|uniref:response regulator transcription factor n=1 Tax=Paenibacillus sp. TaxID=58172 RepID=UPI002D453D65|nr:response regulator [Paenibacillus sp.]HZG85904.1 response regulator [Paenibacillus sp.]